MPTSSLRSWSGCSRSYSPAAARTKKLARTDWQTSIESNARQYCPAANEPWAERFPGIFRIHDGTMQTGVLTGPGLGAVAPS